MSKGRLPYPYVTNITISQPHPTPGALYNSRTDDPVVSTFCFNLNSGSQDKYLVQEECPRGDAGSKTSHALNRTTRVLNLRGRCCRRSSSSSSRRRRALYDVSVDDTNKPHRPISDEKQSSAYRQQQANDSYRLNDCWRRRCDEIVHQTRY